MPNKSITCEYPRGRRVKTRWPRV